MERMDRVEKCPSTDIWERKRRKKMRLILTDAWQFSFGIKKHYSIFTRAEQLCPNSKLEIAFFFPLARDLIEVELKFCLRMIFKDEIESAHILCVLKSDRFLNVCTTLLHDIIAYLAFDSWSMLKDCWKSCEMEI